MAGFSGFETIVLFAGGADKLSLTNANFAGVTGRTITITDSGKGSTVSAAAVVGADHIIVHAGIGADLLTGGTGSDVFFAGGKPTMTGGAGANQFVFTAPGSNVIKDFQGSAANELVFRNSGFNLGLTGGSSAPEAADGGAGGDIVCRQQHRQLHQDEPAPRLDQPRHESPPPVNCSSSADAY
ncbi:MAG TPA: hypothetical protein VGF34_03625 [Stellaceae bacterium]